MRDIWEKLILNDFINDNPTIFEVTTPSCDVDDDIFIHRRHRERIRVRFAVKPNQPK